MINEPADKTSAGFSASFGLDFVWKKSSPQKEDADDKLLSHSSEVKQ